MLTILKTFLGRLTTFKENQHNKGFYANFSNNFLEKLQEFNDFSLFLYF